MASFFARNPGLYGTYEYRPTGHTPDFDLTDWIKNPDMSGVSSVPPKYRKPDGDNVVEMTQLEKDAVDAAIAAAEKAALDAEIVNNLIVDKPGAVSTAVSQATRDNPVWTDPLSGEYGPPPMMQTLINRRELYGDQDTENPVWIDNFDGALVRIQNLETIHGKLGWHNQQIVESSYFRPNDMMIYYGWLRGFNAYWNNELVAQDLARYEVLVIGSGLANPGHGDYANTVAIVNRVKALKPQIKIFGYVQTPLALATFESQVDDWVTIGVQGIFMDEAGYDYGVDRAEFNERVEYVHGEGLIAMANAWNMDHIIGVVDDPSYPNSIYNPTPMPSSLNLNDWYLLESCPINTSAYTGTGGYESRTDWAARCVKAIGHRATFGLNLAACGIVNDANPNGQDLFDFGFVASLMFSLEAWGVSDELYGAGSGKGKWWDRPDVSGMGKYSWLNPSVQMDARTGEEDLYHRYTQFGHLSVDFSSGAQTSTIDKY